MRGVRFSSLRVAAFRGIRDLVVFDLRAPLTLVFAPNGTGKTTMCEAAEWLLTGQVERLKEGKDFDANVLRSKFAESGATSSAAADLIIGEEPRFLARFADGAQSPAEFGEGPDRAATCGPHDLLSQLAPAAAANEVHHLTAINLRQRWLKGTRFLSAEALAALVDTDKETIERRTQVFADLLGIRHLLDAERQCEKYVTELSSRLRALSQVIDRQAAEADALEQALAGGDPAAPATTVSARSEAAAAAALLNSRDLEEEDDKRTLDDRLEALTAVHRRQRHAFDERSRAAQRIEAQWSTRSSLEKAVGDGIALESRLATSLADTEAKGGAAAALVAERSSQRELASDAARALTAAKDRLAQLVAPLLAKLADAGLLRPGYQSLGSLSDALIESRWTGTECNQRRRELTALQAALEQSAREVERLHLLDADLATRRAGLVSEETLAALRSAAVDADAWARAARSLLDATADPVARLQSAARDFLAHDHGTGATKCPACAYDWGDAARLRAALAHTLAEMPEIVALARTGASAASEAARVARGNLDASISARAQVVELEKERANLMAAADQRQREIARLGLASEDILRAIANSRRRIDAAEALANLVAALGALPPTLPGGAAPLLGGETPLNGLFDQLNSTFAAREQVVQLQLAELVTGIEQATETRDQLRASLAATQQSLRECRDGLRDKATELATLRVAWEEAAPGTTWSDAALVSLKNELAAGFQGLARAEAHIAAARSAWEAESRRARLDALRQAIQPSLDRNKRMTDRIAAANRARAVFHDAYTKTSRKQVLDLSRVVNPLFARMHANRVFDRINLGEDADFLHWLADAGGEQLDPGKDFSQGQRQDLALALFLARARSLGGTFFLDEPVLHLDDFNRVGLLDIMRATVLEGSRSLNLVITTSSRSLARHLIEKFAGIRTVATPFGAIHPLRVIELDGNGRSGVQLSSVYPLH
ncbi:MAG TPA: AAA family ATPase [Candidatus Binataceae bacterium]|nr:AAA family ATPase [Candidatus Binataceae bacterium]